MSAGLTRVFHRIVDVTATEEDGYAPACEAGYEVLTRLAGGSETVTPFEHLTKNVFVAYASVAGLGRIEARVVKREV